MTFLWILLGIVYVACWIYFGLATFRKGHYWMFWIGFFIPILWIIGALIAPPTAPRHAPPRVACRRVFAKAPRQQIGELMTTTTSRAARPAASASKKWARRGGAASDGGRAGRPRQGGAGGGAALEPRRLRAVARPRRSGRRCSSARPRRACPELVPIRYGRMLVSPFTFYRGAALIMASDLAATPRSGLTVQCCGDAHLSNFGVFASPERRLVFDVNDFDETLPGPWEWDVKRLAASMLIAARDNGYRAKDQERIVLDTVERVPRRRWRELRRR